MPKYYSVDEKRFDLEYLNWIGSIPVRVSGRTHDVHFHQGFLPGSNVEIYFIDYPRFFHRHTLYTDDIDEDERFILFSKAILELIQRLNWIPDLVHVNDWQAALIPLFIKDNYNWDKNKAYPTKTHREGIVKFGLTPYHRKSYRLLDEQLKLDI